jgi:hypothetical protein
MKILWYHSSNCSIHSRWTSSILRISTRLVALKSWRCIANNIILILMITMERKKANSATLATCIRTLSARVGNRLAILATIVLYAPLFWKWEIFRKRQQNLFLKHSTGWEYFKCCFLRRQRGVDCISLWGGAPLFPPLHTKTKKNKWN